MGRHDKFTQTVNQNRLLFGRFKTKFLPDARTDKGA